MAKYQNKTRETDASVEDYLDQLENPQSRQDCYALIDMMQDITGKPPKMWGDSMVGFGNYHYKYNSGHEGDYFLTGFAPRKRELTIYIVQGFSAYPDLMEKIGKHRKGKSCLYVKHLDQLDQEVLKELISNSVAFMHRAYECS